MIQGIRYYSNYEPSGYGQSALDYIRGLNDTGIAISWIPLVWSGNRYSPVPSDELSKWAQQFHEKDRDLQHLIFQTIAYSHVLIHTVPEYWPEYIESDKVNIGYTAWETDSMPDHWHSLLPLVDKVLVPSEFTKKTFLSTLPDLCIDVVPHIVAPVESPSVDVIGQFKSRFEIDSGARIFYSINAWNIRKSMDRLIHAYQLAFDDSDSVCLLIKTSPTGARDHKSVHHEPVKQIISGILENYPNPAPVILIDERLCEEDIANIHQLGDVYVSLTRGEGWGMGAAQAANLGNPVIITGWGGQLEYLGPDYPGLLDYQLISVKDTLGQGSYQPSQNWAEADLKQAIKQLQETHHDFPLRKEAASIHAASMSKFESTNVTRSLISSLDNINTTRYSIETYEPLEPADIERTDAVPRHFHFVFGLKPQTEPFHILYYICLKSCIAVNKPDRISFYYHHEPYGPWWEKIAPQLNLVTVNQEKFITSNRNYLHHPEGQFIHGSHLSYAHQADFIRLRALIEHGGVYADMDTLFVNPMPEKLYLNDFVIGEEDDLPGIDGVKERSVCNALMLSKPKAGFPQRWLKNMYRVFDGTWSRHSNQEATSLCNQFPDEVFVAPQHYFCPFLPTSRGIARIFEYYDNEIENAYSVHLWNHLWWEKSRVDFSYFHAGLLTEEYIRNGETSYAAIANRYLD